MVRVTRDGVRSSDVRVTAYEAQVCVDIVSGCGYGCEEEKDCSCNPKRAQRDCVNGVGLFQ